MPYNYELIMTAHEAMDLVRKSINTEIKDFVNEVRTEINSQIDEDIVNGLLAITDESIRRRVEDIMAERDHGGTLAKTLERLDLCFNNFDRHILAVDDLVDKRLDEFLGRISNRPTDWKRMIFFEVQDQLRKQAAKPKWYQFWRRRKDN